MVNNSKKTNSDLSPLITEQQKNDNKPNSDLSPQITEHERDHDTYQWKSRSHTTLCVLVYQGHTTLCVLVYQGHTRHYVC